MLESLPEVTGALKVFLVLIFVIALIFAITWLVRRFGADRLAGAAARGRQPRLAVVDQVYMPDQRRKLVIVRRDNVEHLVMIGGPTDVVIEQNIVRAGNAARDKTDPALSRSLSTSEALGRPPVPLGEGTLFPLQPESNGRAARAAEEPVQWTWPPHGETQVPPAPARSEPRLEKPEPSTRPADNFPAAPREPTFTRPVTPPPAARPAPTPPAPAAAPVEKIEKPAVASADENLAEMATRLEASLRRPPEARAAEAPAPLKAEPIVPPALRADPEQRPAPPEPKPAKPEASPKAAFESLEEEMASLLGRPPGKT